MVDISPFIHRRGRALEEIGQGVLALFVAAPTFRNTDVTREFGQDSDSYYLTGFDEPNAALVLVGCDSPRSLLFVNLQDPEREVWDGKCLGVEGAKALGTREALPITELNEQLRRLLSARPSLMCRFVGESLLDPGLR